MAESIFIGREPVKGEFISWLTMQKEARKFAERIDLRVDPMPGTRVAPQRGNDFAQPCGKGFAGIQELLRHKNIRTTVRYTHVGYEQTRQTAEALSQALE